MYLNPNYGCVKSTELQSDIIKHFSTFTYMLGFKDSPLYQKLKNNSPNGLAKWTVLYDMK
jgi:hypothetical protein